MLAGTICSVVPLYTLALDNKPDFTPRPACVLGGAPNSATHVAVCVLVS